MSLITLFKDGGSLSIIEGIYKRWHFLEASLLANIYNDRLEDDAFEKRHLLPFLMHKKRHYLCIESFIFINLMSFQVIF